MARCGAGHCSNLISAASVKTRKRRDKSVLLEDSGMHGDERRHRRGCGGRQGWQVGQHEPCQTERPEDQQAAGQAGKDSSELRQRLPIGQLNDERGGLRQVDHDQRMVEAVAAGADGPELNEFIPGDAERVVHHAERRCDEDRSEQQGGDHGPGDASRHRLPPGPSGAHPGGAAPDILCSTIAASIGALIDPD
jgi:hypothetical protein